MDNAFLQAGGAREPYLLDMLVRKIVFLAGVGIACAAPRTPPPEPEDPTMTQNDSLTSPSVIPSSSPVASPSAGEVVRRLYEEAINQRRFELLTELIAPEYMGPRGKRGPAGFAGVVENLVAGVPDIHFEIEETLSTEGAAAVRWRWSGRHAGTLVGVAPTGKPVTTTGIGIYHVAGGKIVRSYLETDRLGVLQQIGVVPETVGAPRVAR